MTTLDVAIRTYLKEVLPLREVEVAPFADTGSLPYFLKDAYDMRELTLGRRRLVLALQRDPEKTPLARVRTQIQKIAAATGMPAVYVPTALASYAAIARALVPPEGREAFLGTRPECTRGPTSRVMGAAASASGRGDITQRWTCSSNFVSASSSCSSVGGA